MQIRCPHCDHADWDWKNKPFTLRCRHCDRTYRPQHDGICYRDDIEDEDEDEDEGIWLDDVEG